MTPQRLKIADPNALDLGDMLGIGSERRMELRDNFENAIKLRAKGANSILFSDTLEALEEVCYTHEEFTWALINHLAWMYRNNKLIVPKQN